MSAHRTGLHLEGMFSSEKEKYVRPAKGEPDPLGAHGPFLSSLFSLGSYEEDRQPRDG